MSSTHWLRWRCDRVGRAGGNPRVAVKPMPITTHAPARAEPRHERVPSFRLNPKCHVIANGTPIALGQDEIKNNRRRDDAKYKKSDEDDGKNHGRYTQESCCTAVPTNYMPRDLYLSGKLELTFDSTPALHPRNTILDALDGDLGAVFNRFAIEAASPIAVPGSFEKVRDLTDRSITDSLRNFPDEALEGVPFVLGRALRAGNRPPCDHRHR